MLRNTKLNFLAIGHFNFDSQQRSDSSVAKVAILQETGSHKVLPQPMDQTIKIPSPYRAF